MEEQKAPQQQNDSCVNADTDNADITIISKIIDYIHKIMAPTALATSAILTGCIYCFGKAYASYYTIDSTYYNPLESFNIYQLIIWFAIGLFIFLTNLCSYYYIRNKKHNIYQIISMAILVGGVATCCMLLTFNNLTLLLWSALIIVGIPILLLLFVGKSDMKSHVVIILLLCIILGVSIVKITKLISDGTQVEIIVIDAIAIALFQLLSVIILVVLGPLVTIDSIKKYRSNDASINSGPACPEPNSSLRNLINQFSGKLSSDKLLSYFMLVALIFIACVVLCMLEGYAYASNKTSYLVSSDLCDQNGCLLDFQENLSKTSTHEIVCSVVILETKDSYCIQRAVLKKGMSSNSTDHFITYTVQPFNPSVQEWIPKQSTEVLLLHNCLYVIKE